MRIGLFAHRLAQRHPTGIARYVREFVPALARAAGGDDALVIASTREAERPGWVPEGLEVRVLPWPRRQTHAAWCLGRGPRLERGLGHLDVVHLMHPFPPARSGAPQIVTVHDVFPLEHPEWYPRSERWTHRRSMGLLRTRATRIVVASGYVADRLAAMLEIAPARIDVVPHAVSGTFAGATDRDIESVCARYGLRRGHFAVCVGEVSARKNVLAVARGVAQLRDGRTALVIIGADGHGAHPVNCAIARLDGAARIIRTGYLPDAEAAALVRGAAVLAHPALAEGFGRVPLEAMAVGTPVVAARGSSIPELVGDAAVLVDEPAEAAAWAAALSGLLASDERRQELSAAGRQRAASFSWERTAEMMLEIYRHVARS